MPVNSLNELQVNPVKHVVPEVVVPIDVEDVERTETVATEDMVA